MTATKDYVPGVCMGKPVKVLNVFFGDTYIEWPDGTRQWVGRDIKVTWPVDEHTVIPDSSNLQQAPFDPCRQKGCS